MRIFNLLILLLLTSNTYASQIDTHISDRASLVLAHPKFSYIVGYAKRYFLRKKSVDVESLRISFLRDEVDQKGRVKVIFDIHASSIVTQKLEKIGEIIAVFEGKEYDQHPLGLYFESVEQGSVDIDDLSLDQLDDHCRTYWHAGINKPSFFTSSCLKKLISIDPLWKEMKSHPNYQVLSDKYFLNAEDYLMKGWTRKDFLKRFYHMSAVLDVTRVILEKIKEKYSHNSEILKRVEKLKGYVQLYAGHTCDDKFIFCEFTLNDFEMGWDEPILRVEAKAKMKRVELDELRYKYVDIQAEVYNVTIW